MENPRHILFNVGNEGVLMTKNIIFSIPIVLSSVYFKVTNIVTLNNTGIPTRT